MGLVHYYFIVISIIVGIIIFFEEIVNFYVSHFAVSGSRINKIHTSQYVEHIQAHRIRSESSFIYMYTSDFGIPLCESFSIRSLRRPMDWCRCEPLSTDIMVLDIPNPIPNPSRNWRTVASYERILKQIIHISICSTPTGMFQSLWQSVGSRHYMWNGTSRYRMNAYEWWTGAPRDTNAEMAHRTFYCILFEL